MISPHAGPRESMRIHTQDLMASLRDSNSEDSSQTHSPNSARPEWDIEMHDADAQVKSRKAACKKYNGTANDESLSSDSDSECPTDGEDVKITDPEVDTKDRSLPVLRQNAFGENMQVFQVSSGSRTVGAIYPSFKPKSQKKEKRKALRTLTNVPSLEPPTERDRYRREDFACFLRGNYITFSRSDSKALPEPKREVYKSLKPSEAIHPDGNVDFYYELPANSTQVLWWKKKVGNWLARNVLRLDDAIARRRHYYITDFPENYVLYQHRKGPKDDPRTDCYLESTGRARCFRSPAEFYEHAAWLISKRDVVTKERMNCGCKYCRKRRRGLRKKRGVLNSMMVNG